MPSETFYCPHCKSQLTKTAEQYIIGESQKSYFIHFGQLPPYVICPACNGKIDTQKMIKGEYDIITAKPFHPFVSLITVLCYFLGAIVGAGILHDAFNWSWLPALFVGVLIGGAFGEFVGSILNFVGKLLFRKG